MKISNLEIKIINVKIAINNLILTLWFSVKVETLSIIFLIYP
jgi:hypothetical protein